MQTEGNGVSFPWIRGWSMNLNSHFHLVWMSGAIPLLPQEEFYLYDVLDITLSIAGWENQIFKKKISFLCLVLCQEPFFRKLFFVYMYLICILSCITMHRETVTSKISLLVNLEKTNMNPPHTYTIYTSQSVNIPNLLLPQNTPFSLLGFVLSTECSWSHRVIRCCWESVAGLLCWALLVGTGLLLGWVDPAFSLEPEPPTPSSPIKPEHYNTKDIPS